MHYHINIQCVANKLYNKQNLYLAIFYGFYLMLLQKETFYGLNRGYLIFASMFSFAIPFLQIGGINQLIYGKRHLDLIYIDPVLRGLKNGNLVLIAMEQIALTCYFIISLYFIFKLIINIYKIISLLKTARKERLGRIVYVELSNSATAFSFFNLLFINPSSKGKNTILKHEMVHISQKHSVDILFFEILRIINWFNPIVWLIRKEIKLLHEYIADDITANIDSHKHEYAMFLIKNSFGITPNHLTNQIFNQSILKRRINMLNKKKSAGRARLKFLLAAPVVGGMLLASTVAFSKDYAMIDLYPEKYEVNNSMVGTNNFEQNAVHPKKRFKLSHILDQNKRFKKFDSRLVIINGRSAKESIIMQVEGYDRMVELNGKEATAKYGSTASSGALVFTGPNIKILGMANDIKFPPPIVVKDGELPPPPPVEGPRKTPSAPKSSKIKFPPPIVKPNHPELPPPPPVEPPF